MVIRVGILDDHRSFGDAICLALASTAEFDCVGVTTNFERCREMLVALHPDVLLKDYQLVDSTGVECASQLRTEGFTMRIVMLTAHASSQELQSTARKNGVEQVLSKDSPLGKILTAIEAGPGPAASTAERPPLPKFSRRQREVLQLMGKGMPPAEIAESLDVSIHTARRHVKDVMALLGASTQLAAVTVAYRDGHLIPSRSSSGSATRDPRAGNS